MPTRDGGSLLMLAANDPELMAVLIQNGAILDDFDNGGQTALHKAVTAQNGDCVKLLVDAGADVRFPI